MTEAQLESYVGTVDAVALTAHDLALTPCPGAPLADLCDHDPLDLDRDPRLRTCTPAPAPTPCGPLCTPWCLATHS
jgi:hypothetical protein